MAQEDDTKRNGSWIRRIAIGLALIVVAALFWPPRWWPDFSGLVAAAPTQPWLMYLEMGPAIPVHIDANGNRVSPEFLTLSPDFIAGVEQELTRRGARPPRWRGRSRDGSVRMTALEAAMLAGWSPWPRTVPMPALMDPFAEGPVPWPVNDAILYFDRDGNLAFAIDLEEPGDSPASGHLVFREGLAPAYTKVREPGNGYLEYFVEGEDGEWHPGIEPTHFGFVTTDGEWAISPRFDSALPFHEGKAAVSLDGKWGYIDASGAFVVEPRWDDAGAFTEGLAAVYVEGEGWGYIDAEGEWAVAPQFRQAGYFSEGLAAVSPERDGEPLYGYINRDGDWIIEPRFFDASPFRGERAAVSLATPGGAVFGAPYHYINRDGNTVIAGPFTHAMPFQQGEAVVIQRVTPARWLLAMFRHRALNRLSGEL